MTDDATLYAQIRDAYRLEGFASVQRLVHGLPDDGIERDWIEETIRIVREVEAARAATGLVGPDAGAIAKIMAAFDLHNKPYAASLVYFLWQCRGVPASNEACRKALYGPDRFSKHHKIVHVWSCYARKKLPEGTLAWKDHRGQNLTPAGLKLIDELLGAPT